MTKIKEFVNKLVLLTYLRRHLVIFIFSIISLLLIFFNLNNSSMIFIQSEIIFLNTFFQVILLSITGFVITLLPCYPIFFIIFKNKNFNFLEKLSLTIIANLAFYILTGYIANYFGIPITGYFFFILILIIYFSLLFYIIIYEKRTRFTIFLKIEEFDADKQSFYESFSIFNYIKRRFPLIGLLIIIFLILLSIQYSVRFSYFYGTDAIYHVFMTKIINEVNYLPLDQYYGALGLHLFTALIHFFSGIDQLILAKYFSFYTFFVSGLIIYNILMRIFKNRNLAILGVFLIEFTSLGFSYIMYQFWPTSLATIQSLSIFFLLYSRLENLIKEKPPKKRKIFSNLAFTYIFIILIYISALFTHSLISTIYMVSFTFIFLLYFSRNYKRGIDLIILCVCFGIFFALFNITGISSHWVVVNILMLPWYFLVIAGIIGLLIILKFRSGIKFEKNKFKSVIWGHKYGYYRKIEDKFLFPLFFLFLIIFIIGFVIFNLNILDLNLSNIFAAIECFIVIFFGIWGLTLFQKKPRGKPLVLWFFGMVIVYLLALFLDIFVLHDFWSGRILLLFSPILIFGFISYLYKLIKLKSIIKLKIKIFILSVIVFMFFTQFSDQLLDIDNNQYSLHRREVYSLRWYSNYTSEVNLVISEFGNFYVIMYYEYPYEENNKSILANNLINFILDLSIFKPANHFYANGTNKLQQMKETLNTDIYLILDDNYLPFSEFDVNKRLSEEEMEEYYSMDYLNKICSSKSENGIDFPFYWVI